MDRSINQLTNELVSAFEVYKNGSYQNLKKGEWISPKDSIYNWEEILEKDSYVHYVKEKSYTNFKGTYVAVSPYFAVYPNSKAKTVLESPEHKMLKDWLFNSGLKEDDLEIIYSRPTKKSKYDNSNKLSELNIDWNNYSIEVPIRSIKNLRADILLPFKNKHPILGFGIIIEIQLSNQNTEITWDRTFDRSICGYSTIWLFKKDFEISNDKKEIELKNSKLKVLSFASELKYGGKKFMKGLKIGVETQCRFLDIKKQELNKKKEEIENYKEKFINDVKKRINNFLDNKLKELGKNFNEEIIKRIQKDFFINNKEDLKNILRDISKEIIDIEITEEFINNISKEINYKSIIEEKITKDMKGFYSWKLAISDAPPCFFCKDDSLKLINKKNGDWAYVCESCKKWTNLPKEIEEKLRFE